MRESDLRDLRQAVVDTARAMNQAGINQGVSGNVSVRAGSGFLITASGVAYDRMTPDQAVFVRPDGSHAGLLQPSSEWRFHRDIYGGRPDAGAIVHSHAPYATSLACVGRAIPSFHYMVAAAGGSDIRCADYATFGTQELSDNILRALDGRTACLIANHGMVAFGADLQKALSLAIEVEALAAQYWRALQIGEPALLSDSEMRRVLEKFESYGRQPSAEK